MLENGFYAKERNRKNVSEIRGKGLATLQFTR